MCIQTIWKKDFGRMEIISESVKTKSVHLVEYEGVKYKRCETKTLWGHYIVWYRREGMQQEECYEDGVWTSFGIPTVPVPKRELEFQKLTYKKESLVHKFV